MINLVEIYNDIVLFIILLFIFLPTILNDIKILLNPKNIFEGKIINISTDNSNLPSEEIIFNTRHNIMNNCYCITVEIYLNENRQIVYIIEELNKLPNIGDKIKVYINSKEPYKGFMLLNNYRVHKYIEVIIILLIFLLFFVHTIPNYA